MDFTFCASSFQANSGDEYMSPGMAPSTFLEVMVPVPSDQRITGMYVHQAVTVPGSSESVEYRLRLNGADTDISISILASDADGSAMVNADLPISSGDLLSVAIRKNLTGASPQMVVLSAG